MYWANAWETIACPSNCENLRFAEHVSSEVTGMASSNTWLALIVRALHEDLCNALIVQKS
jgi:hypothetical protein